MYQSLLESKTDCPISGVFSAGKTQVFLSWTRTVAILAQVATFAQALEASVGGLLGLNCPSLLFS